MSVPDYQSFMLPVLKALAGGRETPIAEVRKRIAVSERLTVADMKEMLPTARQSVFVNRVSWAISYLGNAGLAERIRRGRWRLTVEGEKLLADPPVRIDLNYLQRYPAYVSWRTGKKHIVWWRFSICVVGPLCGHTGRSLG